MDISVSHLNRRLAVQLPARLPLGLVFVVGRVESVQFLTGRKLDALRFDGRFSRVQFDLVEKGYFVRCELSARAAAEVDLEVGDEVRASGHLAFDSHRASYILLARDVELVADATAEFAAVISQPSEHIGRTALTPILADIKKRSEVAQQQLPEDLPYWVQKMAPPEFRSAELSEEAVEATAVSNLVNGQATLDLDDGLVDFLSQAMDSDETIELTPSLLSEYPTSSLEQIKQRIQVPRALAKTADMTVKQAATIQEQQRYIDRLVIAFIVLIVLLTIVALIGVVLLL